MQLFPGTTMMQTPLSILAARHLSFKICIEIRVVDVVGRLCLYRGCLALGQTKQTKQTCLERRGLSKSYPMGGA